MERPHFAVRAMDAAAKPARLRVYSTFATTSAACVLDLPVLRRMKEELGAEGVDVVAIPVDPADDNPRLGTFAREKKPASRLVNLPAAQRPEAVAAFTQALGQDPPLPSTVITDEAGRILFVQPGIPNLSTLRKLLHTPP
jgi:hypothetical protein